MKYGWSRMLRFLGLVLALTGCVPVQSSVSPVNIEGKTFKVELPGESDEESAEGTGMGPLNRVAGRICPQGFRSLEASSSWNPLNGRVYRYTVEFDDAPRGLNIATTLSPPGNTTGSCWPSDPCPSAWAGSR